MNNIKKKEGNNTVKMPRKSLDQWQKDVLETEGNICLRSGRQVGKSTIISQKAAEYAIKHPGKEVMIVASVERQAVHLFLMVQNYLQDYHPKKVKGRMTLSFAQLHNGSIIRCMPAGDTGRGIRGYTIDLLICDEAAYIRDEVFTAITPMLAITRGKMILLSTPHGKEGYFYDCFEDESFTSFHISSEDCPRKDQEFLDREKKRMTKGQYAQEYLGEFVDELRRLFSNELIDMISKLKRHLPYGNKFLGVDIARMGADESVLVSLDRINKEYLKMFDIQITTQSTLTDTARLIIQQHKKYNYKKIYLDDGGIGAGVLDILLEDNLTKRRTVPINNSSRNLDSKGEKSKKLMKVELYNNLLRLMQQGKIEILNHPEIKQSLRSIQYEYDNGVMKIFGNYSHIAEALIRAAWCVQDKTLNIYVY